MANINMVEDSKGELLELEYFCSDFCAKQSDNYAGWYGCVELYSAESCQTCEKQLNFVGDN